MAFSSKKYKCPKNVRLILSKKKVAWGMQSVKTNDILYTELIIGMQAKKRPKCPHLERTFSESSSLLRSYRRFCNNMACLTVARERIQH